ncbi:hypothetical protein WJX75_007800 [Coccomyxa subellipsoidea]|uniref:Uncharacterized protein n=1 Tax=Coccomyxa subellipsoidea TaxID=248742 RepID=A0ABR2YYF8_9CHLO
MERSACSLLSQIEQELAALRVQTVQNLEQKLNEREQQLSTVSSRFLQLQQDFKYNLELLDGRDAELIQYEAEVNDLQSGLEQQGGLVEELQSFLAKAQADLEREQQLLQTATEAAMLAELAEARSKLESLVNDNARLQTAQEEAARRLAAAERSAASAQQSCAEASAQGQALQRSREAAERELSEARAQLDRERKYLQKSIAQLEEERDLSERGHKATAMQLRAELEAATAAAREAEWATNAAASSAAEQQTQLRGELAQLSGRCAAAEAAEREAAKKLETAQKEQQHLEERLKSQNNAETSGLRRQLQELKRRNEKEVHSCKEAAAAEIKFLTAKIGSLQAALKAVSSNQKVQEAQAALSKREAEPSSLRAEMAALQKGLPQAARTEAGMAAAAPPIGFSAAAAVRYSQISPGWDLSEPESPEWLQGPLKAAEGERAFEEDAARQLRLENAGLQAALERKQEENKKLCAALATLSTDMEALSHAVKRPVADTSPRVAELERQVAEAQRSVERLTAENERLMELSSELRAHRHKADRAAALAGSAPQQATPAGAMRLRRIEALAEEIALAQVHGGQNRQRIANNRSSRLSMGNEGPEDAQENAGVVGANMAVSRVNVLLNTASSRCTPSQRERLRAMQQKSQAPKVPRVRNWNIIDDQEALNGQNV